MDEAINFNYVKSKYTILNKLKNFSLKIQWLSWPVIILGIISLITIVMVLVTSQSNEDNKFFIPSILSLVWSMNTYVFIAAFRFVPEKADKTMGFFLRLKTQMSRIWYSLIALSLVVITFLMMFLSYKIILVWLNEYGF